MLGLVHQERARLGERWIPIPEHAERFLGNMDFQGVLGPVTMWASTTL